MHFFFNSLTLNKPFERSIWYKWKSESCLRSIQSINKISTTELSSFIISSFTTKREPTILWTASFVSVYRFLSLTIKKRLPVHVKPCKFTRYIRFFPFVRCDKSKFTIHDIVIWLRKRLYDFLIWKFNWRSID